MPRFSFQMLNLNLPNEFLYVAGCVKLHPQKKKKKYEASNWLDHFYY